MPNEDFTGAKIAYIYKDSLLVYKRDDFSHIPFPGYWDFPGGGRENNESPEACVLRELNEEFSFTFPASRFVFKKRFVSSQGGHSFFFVALGKKHEIDSILFGDEGQFWKLMPINEYLSHPKAVPHLARRFEHYQKNNLNKS